MPLYDRYLALFGRASSKVRFIYSNSGVKVAKMGCSLIETAEPKTSDMGQPWEGGASEWSIAPILLSEGSEGGEEDPFDDFDEDDFDDDFDDDFEEDWEDDLTEDNEFPDTFGGHEDDDEKKATPEKKAPFNDDPDFDK